MTTLTKTQHHYSATIQKELAELKETTRHTAKTDAETNHPAPTGDRLQDYISFIHTTCQSLLDKQAGELKPKSTLHTTINNNQEGEKQLKTLLHKKGEAEHQKNQTATALKNTPQPPCYTSRKKAVWVILILCFFESLWSISLFQSWGFSQLESYLFSPLFAVLFALIAHMVPKLLHLVPTPKQKRMTLALLGSITFFALYYLGTVRADFLTQQTSYEHHAMPFAVFSFLLLVSATLISYFYLPYTKEAKEAIARYDQLKGEAEQAEHTFTSLEQQIAELRQQKTTQEGLSVATLEEGGMNENLILNTCQECIALYISTNKKHREHPSDCYTQTVDFQFRTHFLPLFDSHSNTNNSNQQQNPNSNENTYTI